MYKSLDIKKLIQFTKTLKVLYVEDNTEARDALKSLLSNFFDDITLGVDGENGLEKFQSSKFNLIITDIKMPKMNGIEMMEKIRSIDDEIPIIVSTAHQDQEFLISCIELGINSYLLKPINHKQLTRAIKNTCEKLYYIYENKKYEESLEVLVKERTKKLQATQKQLTLMVNKDPLTNLYNRRYFNDVSQTLLDLARRENDGLSLMMIDIDKFKIVNDTYGHLVGDILLKELAYTLLKVTRNSDVVIRFGGEEFLILLPHTHIDGATMIAQKIKDTIKNLEIYIGNKIDKILKLTVSIGVTQCYCDDDNGIDTIVHRADEAMYEAKQKGRDMIVIYQKNTEERKVNDKSK